MFEFDYDLTWYCFFLNADETIYGRYGGRDASDAHARISLKGLRFSLESALKAHQSPPKPQLRSGQPVQAEDFAAAKRHNGCIHCHNVKEFQRANQQASGRWSRDDLWVYPLPENVGITLDVDAGDRVKNILPGSPADQVGLKPGDRLKTLAGRSVASFADTSYALHKAPAKGEIPVIWVRDGREHAASLELADGWRKTNLTWRPSMLDLLPALPFSGDDLTAAEKKQRGLAPERAAFRQDKFVHSTLKAVGVKKHDVVIGFDGHTVNGTMTDLLGYVRRNYLVGDRIKANILRDGKPMDVTLVLK